MGDILEMETLANNLYVDPANLKLGYRDNVQNANF